MMVPIHLIGLPTDHNSSFEAGAALAPAAIREALWSDRGNMAAECGLEVGVDIDLIDKGDISLTNTDNAIDDAMIVGALASTGIPLILGGDHAVSYPVVAALAARHGPLNILHFDAHPDLYDDFEGNPRSHASPFARIMEKGHAVRLVQVHMSASAAFATAMDRARRGGGSTPSLASRISLVHRRCVERQST